MTPEWFDERMKQLSVGSVGKEMNMTGNLVESCHILSGCRTTVPYLENSSKGWGTELLSQQRRMHLSVHAVSCVGALD